ncbi:hypothetical protein PITC_082520 [Penicillium italicum]|uniref:Uncharacterized protein n=1 Tax=Penicillium italicum TaxID=40296 RepID=A0A0A2LFZ1_PENIT|nr:hypothetical protein PITC_082520 [Penicillium italicum]
MKLQSSETAHTPRDHQEMCELWVQVQLGLLSP